MPLPVLHRSRGKVPEGGQVLFGPSISEDGLKPGRPAAVLLDPPAMGRVDAAARPGCPGDAGAGRRGLPRGRIPKGAQDLPADRGGLRRAARRRRGQGEAEQGQARPGAAGGAGRGAGGDDVQAGRAGRRAPAPGSGQSGLGDHPAGGHVRPEPSACGQERAGGHQAAERREARAGGRADGTDRQALPGAPRRR